MLQLHYSNQLEKLIEPLAAAIRDRQAQEPITRIPIIVANRAVEQFVKYRLAERLGVAANLEFPFLRHHLAEIVKKAEPQIQILDADELRMVLFECIRDPARRSLPEMAAVRSYAESAAVGIDGRAEARRELRLFQLAERIARLFREYSITRERMLQEWRDRRRFTEGPFAETEKWQYVLWRAAFDAKGELRSEFRAEPSDRWMMLPDAFASITPVRLRSVAPPAIHIFALPNAGPAYVRIFSILAQVTELHVYALNPCLEFWEDVQTIGHIARESWVRRGARLKEEISNAKDQFLLLDGDTRALKLWGRPGREYVRLLNELTQCDFDARFERPAASGEPSLLATLQADILMREPEAEEKREGDPAFAGDRSIRILACPGVRREVEAVAGAIWSLIVKNSEKDPIRFHEIAVLIPEAACDTYLPHIEAVFQEQHGLPVEIVPRRFVRQSRVAEAIDLLLKLPLGRFTRDEMVTLLTHPAVAGDDGDYDVERWSAWCREVGVVFGADADELRNTYIGAGLFHWDQALTRLALGVFMTGERSGNTGEIETPQGKVLPFEAGQEFSEGIAHIVRLAREIIADAIAMRSRELTVEEWSELLTALVGKYVRADEPTGERVRAWCLRAIAEMAPRGIQSGPVPYEIAHEIAVAAIGAAESEQARLAGGGVAAGSMTWLRALPFRAIFVMGLGETLFPEREKRDPLDLTLAERIAGDVSPTERDRYLFLEALLSAREQVFLSYVSRDPQTGEALEPSAAIRELEFILKTYVAPEVLERMTIVHPVSRYDLRYFPDLSDAGEAPPDAELASFDPDARRGARIAALRADLRCRAGNLTLPGRELPLIDFVPASVAPRLREALGVIDIASAAETAAAASEEIAVPFTALVKFLGCPLQGAARYALGMFDEEDGDDEDTTDEPLTQVHVERVMLLREAFWDAQGKDSELEPALARRFALAQMKGRAPAGVFAEIAHRKDREELQVWSEQAEQSGAGSLTEWEEVRLGNADEFTPAGRVLQPLMLEKVPIKNADGQLVSRRVKIYGSVGRFAPSFGMALHGILRKKVKTHDFLRMFLGAVALSAAGAKLPKRFRAIVIGASEEPTPKRERSFARPPQDEARTYLTLVVSDMLSVGNDYFLPFEAVEKALAAMRNGDGKSGLVAAVENVRENDWARCQSDFGPVRDARGRFKPPGEDEIRRVIERRFKPIEGLFDGEE
jgi:exodeoxyribonuclease V gamma subunit